MLGQLRAELAGEPVPAMPKPSFDDALQAFLTTNTIRKHILAYEADAGAASDTIPAYEAEAGAAAPSEAQSPTASEGPAAVPVDPDEVWA